MNQTIDFLIVCPVSPSAVHISFTICGKVPILSLIKESCNYNRYYVCSIQYKKYNGKKYRWGIKAGWPDLV